MNPLEVVEALVQNIPCPVCLNTRFEVKLSCELPRSACDTHAVCGHCHHKFVVTQDFKAREDLLDKVKAHLAGSGCPQCRSKQLAVEYLCDLGTEDCFFLARCQPEGHYSRIDTQSIRYLFP